MHFCQMMMFIIPLVILSLIYNTAATNTGRNEVDTNSSRGNSRSNYAAVQNEEMRRSRSRGRSLERFGSKSRSQNDINISDKNLQYDVLTKSMEKLKMGERQEKGEEKLEKHEGKSQTFTSKSTQSRSRSRERAGFEMQSSRMPLERRRSRSRSRNGGESSVSKQRSLSRSRSGNGARRSRHRSNTRDSRERNRSHSRGKEHRGGSQERRPSRTRSVDNFRSSRSRDNSRDALRTTNILKEYTCRCGFKVDSTKWIEKNVKGKTYMTYPIGQGGSAKVSHGYASGSNKCVAIKEIQLKSESVLKEYENEIVILNHFKNIDGIIQLIEFERKADMLTMVLELGEYTLTDWVKPLLGNVMEISKNLLNSAQKEIISTYLQTVTDITIQLLDALNNFHEAAIHQDIKPANVVIINKRAKLIDFGFSAFFQDKEKKTITHKDHFYGTYQFASPEHLNDQTYDTKVDIWSLGITVYQMLFGFQKFPYEIQESDFYQNMFLGMQWDRKLLYPKKLSNLYADVNNTLYKRLKMLIRNCMEFEPTKRLNAIKLKQVLLKWKNGI